MRHRLAFMAAAFALVSGHAFAGVVATSTHTQLDSKKTEQVMVYVEADRLKVMMPDTTVIYRSDLDRFWVISPAKKNYMEMTGENMRAMGGQMQSAQATLNAAQARIQAELAKLPPEQRALIEKQMAAQGLGTQIAPAPRTRPASTYAKAGQSKTVPSGRCDVYARSTLGVKEADLCIAPIAAAGLSPADFKVFDSFMTFVAPVASSPMAPKQDFMNWAEMNKAIGFQGIPLDTVTFADGKPSMEDTVQSIVRTAIPTATFELPPGLTKQEMPTGFPGGR